MDQAQCEDGERRGECKALGWRKEKQGCGWAGPVRKRRGKKENGRGKRNWATAARPILLLLFFFPPVIDPILTI